MCAVCEPTLWDTSRLRRLRNITILQPIGQLWTSKFIFPKKWLFRCIYLMLKMLLYTTLSNTSKIWVWFSFILRIIEQDNNLRSAAKYMSSKKNQPKLAIKVSSPRADGTGGRLKSNLARYYLWLLIQNCTMTLQSIT